MADEEEEFEVLDLSAVRRNRGHLQQILGDISKQSAAKQVIIGGAAGCASGYLSVKVGKSAAITIGVTLLIIRCHDPKFLDRFSGYLFVKVGKIAACSLGTTLLLIQIAQHQGYIQINWSRVNREVNRAKRRVEQEANRQYPQLVENLRKFAQQNMFLAGSFAGGFFLGMAF